LEQRASINAELHSGRGTTAPSDGHHWRERVRVNLSAENANLRGSERQIADLDVGRRRRLKVDTVFVHPSASRHTKTAT
jgi:hypothetical protein